MNDVESNYLIPLQAVCEALRAGRTRVHIPQPLGLLQNQPGMHFHPHPELFIQLSGRRRFVCPLEMFEINEGDICLLPAQLPHRENAFDGTRAPFDGIVLWVERGQLSIHRSIAHKNGERPGVGPSQHLNPANGTTLSQLLESLTTVDEPEIHSPLLYALLRLIHNCLRDHNQTPPPPPAEPSAALVQSARAIIRAYLPDANLTVQRIAAEVGCSADHLSRCFQKHLGLPAQNYLQSERLSLACRLLKKPGLRICEVAWACGFRSANYFIRAFRQQTGRTPKQFRRE